MLVVFLLAVALFVFMLVRRSQRKRDPKKFSEKSAQRAMRLKKLQGKVLLWYSGGHPNWEKSGACWVIRSVDDKHVELRIGKESVSIPTESITKVELITHSELKTIQKSGVGGAIVGEIVAGPFGAIVGGLATRKTKSKKINKDLIVVTINNNETKMQLLFQCMGNKAPQKWYPRAAAILSPSMEA